MNNKYVKRLIYIMLNENEAFHSIMDVVEYMHKWWERYTFSCRNMLAHMGDDL